MHEKTKEKRNVQSKYMTELRNKKYVAPIAFKEH